jgi:diacylglycerol kinase
MPTSDHRLRELKDRVAGEHRRTLRQSFADAVDGLHTALRERNMRIHVFFAVLVLVLGFVVDLSSLEWAGLFLVVGVVIRDEIVNTAIERLVDLQAPLSAPTPEEIRLRARDAKHLAAASVLWGAMTAIICGTIIIVPRIVK